MILGFALEFVPLDCASLIFSFMLYACTLFGFSISDISPDADVSSV